MKYLVTGGAGFIGSNLVDELIKQGHEVRIVDNFSTGKKENLNSKAEFWEVDIRNLEALKPAFVGVDGVFHTAALPRVQLSIENPLETNEVNITGTLNVILASREAKIKRIVYSASSSAYGDAVELPLHEGMKPNPKSPYGLQKYVGEEYMRLASLFYGIETVNLRYFNVYGPRMSDDGPYCTVIGIFLRKKKDGQPLTIFGDGTVTRDFTHVRDVVRANISAMTSAKVGKGEVINVGAGNNHTVQEVAEMIGGEIQYLPPRVEPHDTLANNNLAREFLNWQPQVDFKDGVEELKKLHGLV